MATGGITFDGSTQYLEYSANLVSAYPLTFVAWLASSKSGSGEAGVVCHGSTTADAWQYVGYQKSSENKLVTDRSAAAGSSTSTKSTTPNISNTAYGLLVGVIASPSSMVVYFVQPGDSTATGSTPQAVASSQNFSNLNRFLIGAARRSTGAERFVGGSICEVHVFNTALTSTDVITMLTTKPDTMTGWVDGWALGSASDLTSLGGTRTLTATGSPTTASLTLPYTRTGGGGSGPAPFFNRPMLGGNFQG